MKPHRRRVILVTGSRDWTDRAAIQDALDTFRPTLLVTGGAVGADLIADAVAHTANIDRCVFPANWGGRGKAAGPYRNRLMFDITQPDLVLAFPLPQSRGTLDMVDYARSQNCEVLVKGTDF